MSQILGIYKKFVVEILLGASRSTDEYLSQHETVFRIIAAMANARFQPPLSTVYRGIFLPSSHQASHSLKLKPILGRKTISFSEDINIAKEFTEPSIFERILYSQKGIGDIKPYLISHRLERSQILYHNSWAKPLGIEQMIIDFWGREYGEEIARQKEVVLFQDGIEFDLIPLA